MATFCAAAAPAPAHSTLPVLSALLVPQPPLSAVVAAAIANQQQEDHQGGVSAVPFVSFVTGRGWRRSAAIYTLQLTVNTVTSESQQSE